MLPHISHQEQEPYYAMLLLSWYHCYDSQGPPQKNLQAYDHERIDKPAAMPPIQASHQPSIVGLKNTNWISIEFFLFLDRIG